MIFFPLPVNIRCPCSSSPRKIILLVDSCHILYVLVNLMDSLTKTMFACASVVWNFSVIPSIFTVCSIHLVMISEGMACPSFGMSFFKRWSKCRMGVIVSHWGPSICISPTSWPTLISHLLLNKRLYLFSASIVIFILSSKYFFFHDVKSIFIPNTLPSNFFPFVFINESMCSLLVWIFFKNI